MQTREFDYDLSPERIAQVPLPEREMSRMLAVRGECLEDRLFTDLPDFLRPGDLVVLNESRVFPARLREGKTEILFLRRVAPEGCWEALCRPARRFRSGTCVVVKGLRFEVTGSPGPFGKRVLRWTDRGDLQARLEELGEPPLPPYIRRPATPETALMDRERYQTVFARTTGSAAAPTAGLHFTTAMLDRIRQICEVTSITLHVSNATFQPIRSANIEDHRMEPEAYSIGDAAARAIRSARRVVAVGTTVVRALESAAAASGHVATGSGEATAYIMPGHRFRVVGALLTNFHQPRSSLLVLVSAFAGIGIVRRAYQYALGRGYRFLSYGDCMFFDR